MRVVFISNYLNHHQLPLSNAMADLTKGKYSFIATTCFNEKRRGLGYVDMNKSHPFVVRAYESEHDRREAEYLTLNSDVVITGSAPEKYTAMRIAQNKLTFRYAERSYKNGYFNWKVPLKLIRGLWRDTRYYNRNLFMLCASAYTAHDCSLHRAYIDKTFKWGYFSEVKMYEDLNELFEKKEHEAYVSILWTGRFLDWKHPDVSIQVAEKLKKLGYKFKLDIIGNGNLEKKLRNMIVEKGLTDCVHMPGSMSPDDVRKHMERANIYLFTSDFNEGWGVVLNESMNSGCAVVASHAIGSVPFLIKNGENGLIYENGNEEHLFAMVKKLMDNPQLCRTLGENAYYTLQDEWNAKVAAERFLKLVDCINNGGDYNNLFASGPCSRAEIIKNGWFNGK